MKLVKATVVTVELPLRVPFRTALRATSAVTDIRVILQTDDGLVGIGSASPTPAITGDTTAGITAALNDHILPRLQTVDLDDASAAFRAIEQSIVHNTSAKAAADIALHDLYAKASDQPLVKWLGGSPKTIVTDATVSLGAIETMVQQAKDLVSEGFKVLKVKLGNRDGLDVERIRQIRAAIGSEAVIRVDANQAWTVKQSVQYARQLEPFEVELIEQPLPAHDISGMRTVTQNSAIPIAADESVYGMHELLRVLDEQAADIVNIKLMKSSGLHQARSMVELVQSAGLTWMLGSMMEGPASVTAAAALAAALDCPYIDLDAAYFLSSYQATGGIRYARNQISLPDGPGLGVLFESC